MKSAEFVHEGAEYMIVGDGLAILKRIIGPFSHFIVSSSVSVQSNDIKYSSYESWFWKLISSLISSSPVTTEFKIVGVSKQEYYKYYEMDKRPADVISFDESSEVEEVQTTFIELSRSTFYLPPRVKRIRSDSSHPLCRNIIGHQMNQYVSVTGKRFIMNHHPLELLFIESHRNKILIRETIRVIGSLAAFKSLIITSVVLPPSVEVIDDYAFYCCYNLHSVEFKGRSNLKKIGKSAFQNSGITKFTVSSSVEEIGQMAFEYCTKLSSLTFQKGSKLKKIAERAFIGDPVLSIEFPASVEEICEYALNGCNRLSSISFPDDSKLRKIHKSAFSDTAIQSVEFPESLECIGYLAFYSCVYLSSISFRNNSLPKIIDQDAFMFCHNLKWERPSYSIYDFLYIFWTRLIGH